MSANRTIKINPQRLEYMMDLFDLNRQELLSRISEKPNKLKNKLTEEQIFGDVFIKVSHLKRIDEVFRKGLSFYTDPVPISKSESASIFFRKKEFNSELGIGDRRRISETEDNILYLSGLAELADMPDLTTRELETYQESDSPDKVAQLVREKLYPQEPQKTKRDFLKALINCFADYNIFVYEFVEQHNLVDKAKLDGFFISPNHITIKRHQYAFSREIFTLAHELGHYLLDQEEIDHIDHTHGEDTQTEKWCNRFAFHFLMDSETLEKLYALPKENLNFYDDSIGTISRTNHISRLALFTHLFDKGKISWPQYQSIGKASDKYMSDKALERKEKSRRDRELGKKPGGRSPKPILSALEKDIYVSAYLNGAIDEYQVLKRCSSGKSEGIDDIIYD